MSLELFLAEVLETAAGLRRRTIAKHVAEKLFQEAHRRPRSYEIQLNDVGCGKTAFFSATLGYGTVRRARRRCKSGV
jgi:hypothetical protein